VVLAIGQPETEMTCLAPGCGRRPLSYVAARAALHPDRRNGARRSPDRRV